MNPYVESTFADWVKGHRLAPNASRETAPLPLPAVQQLAGTSSFGMSGVNAHALFEAAPATDQDHGAGLATLRRQRHWGLAPALYLADRALPGGGRGGRQARPAVVCSLLCNLSKPELAYLWHHQVCGVGGEG